jgi:hypothetical protein
MQGMMDGWHGDENECNGHCGLCEDCERRADEKGEQDFESWRDEQLFD